MEGGGVGKKFSGFFFWDTYEKLSSIENTLTIEASFAKQVTKVGFPEAFIAMHRNADELTKLFNNVRKLSRVQPMPYKYVKTWFENRFPYYSEQPTFDADGFVIDPATLTAMKEMVQEVAAANQMAVIEANAA